MRGSDGGHARIITLNRDFETMRYAIPAALLLVLVCAIFVSAADGSSAEPSYSYDTSTSTLTVESDVPDYADSSETPWSSYIGVMTGLKVSEGVTSLGSNAFSGADRLETVSLPSTLKSVGAGTFSGCVWLGSLYLPSSVDSIGSGAFAGCSRLATVTVCSSPSVLGTGIFDDSGSLVEGFGLIILAQDVPAYMFVPSLGHSVMLNYLDLSSAVSVAKEAFRGVQLGSLTVPMNVSSVGDRAFAQSSVGSVRIEGSPALGTHVFEGCTSLVSARIGSLRTVPEHMFSGCSSLEDVTFSERISEISDGAFSGTALKELVFPGTLSKVGASAFGSCTSLTHAAFTDTLERLGDGAFEGCTSLATAEVQGVSHPGSYVFDGCTGLQRAFCPETAVEFPAGTVYRDTGGGPDVLITYDFGELDGKCTLFADTVMMSSYIDGSENHGFEYWTDPDGNRVSDVSALTESTVLTANWSQAEGADGTFGDAVLCVLSAACAVTACFVCLRRS